MKLDYDVFSAVHWRGLHEGLKGRIKNSMPKFHDSETAAKITGYSVRHFRRLAIESGNPGLDFSCGHHKRFKYTDEQIARIMEYVKLHPYGRPNSTPGKVWRKTQSKLVSGR